MKTLIKKEYKNLLLIITLLFLIHLPLMTKNIISADILLNNYFYKGYSWEISLGRFGLYIIGILKSFITVPHIDLLISYVFISISTILLIDLFNIKDKIKKILLILIIVLSPITSSTLLFNYCSIGYTFAFLGSVSSIYIFYKETNKYLKYIIPIILIVLSLSMYQAYLSLIVTLFVIYNLKLILDKKENYKELFKYLILLIIGILFYFISMKLSQLVFHIDMSSYSNANEIGINTILTIPNKIIDTYKLTYRFFFTNSIIKNTYLHNNIINLLILITIIISIIVNLFRNNISNKNKIITILIILTLPIYLNSIIFVISGTKLQLLMSSSYLLIYLLLIYLIPKNNIKYLNIILIILLLRNNLIQVQSTYLTLENTFNRYNLVIDSAIRENINNSNTKYVVIGKDKVKSTNISKQNYGFISDDSILWKEYNLRKLGFTRFCEEYYGLNINYLSEDKALELENNRTNKLIENRDDITIINLDYLK